MSDKRIAIVHERLTEIAGSEHVVEQLALQWPDAEVYTSIATPRGTPAGLTRRPHTSWLDKAYRLSGERSWGPLMPFMPLVFRRFDIRDVDAVITSHHAFATQVVFATDAPVVAYVHSPARWAWDASLRAGEGGGPLGAGILTGLAAVARRCEVAAAPRLAAVVANSTAVAERIQQWWGREASVVPPPVDIDGFTPDPSIPREDFFLLAGRLVAYKRPDLAVRAAQQAGVRLVVAGEGRALAQCRALAGPQTTFLGRIPHTELLDLHRRCRALVMPGVEDFGIVPVESMATGTPVIALGAGGAIDTVVPQVTGLHIATGADDQIVEGFAEAMRTFDPDAFDRNKIRQWALQFSRDSFRRRMYDVVQAI